MNGGFFSRIEDRGSRSEDGDSRTTIVHPPSSILELSPVARRPRVRLVLFLDLLGQIVLISDFLYLVQLRFDPVDMLLLVDENMLQKLPRGVVRNFDTGFDAVAQDDQSGDFQGEVVIELLFYFGADLDLFLFVNI